VAGRERAGAVKRNKDFEIKAASSRPPFSVLDRRPSFLLWQWRLAALYRMSLLLRIRKSYNQVGAGF
jgi:hypothetical protein